MRLCSIDPDTLTCSECGERVSGPRVKRNCGQPVVSHAEQVAPPITRGPGTELKKLLALIGITSAPDCACNAHAAEMDRMGGEWCADNLDTIVGWLREQATARGLPFLDAAGKMLVKRAIRNAARAAALTQ